MRFLALSSLLFLLCIGCGRNLYKELTPLPADASALKKLQPSFTTTLYRAQIEVVGKHLSGLLFFKKLPDASYRVVFTNEMGLNLFDFHFSEQKFEVIHCIDQLNKKPVINQLRKDIGFLLMTDMDFAKGRKFRNKALTYYRFQAGKEFTYYITDSATSRLHRVENTTARRRKVVVSLTKPMAGMPDSVFVDHKLFDFTISLKQIPR